MYLDWPTLLPNHADLQAYGLLRDFHRIHWEPQRIWQLSPPQTDESISFCGSSVPRHLSLCNRWMIILFQGVAPHINHYIIPRGSVSLLIITSCQGAVPLISVSIRCGWWETYEILKGPMSGELSSKSVISGGLYTVVEFLVGWHLLLLDERLNHYSEV